MLATKNNAVSAINSMIHITILGEATTYKSIDTCVDRGIRFPISGNHYCEYYLRDPLDIGDESTLNHDHGYS